MIHLLPLEAQKQRSSAVFNVRLGAILAPQPGEDFLGKDG